MASAPVMVNTQSRKGFLRCAPVFVLCCLGVILFLIAATIILSLIPVYFMSKTITPKYTGSSLTKYILFNVNVHSNAKSSRSVTPCVLIPCPIACNGFTSSASIPKNAVACKTCGCLVQSGKRRRRSYAGSLSRFRRDFSELFYLIITINLAEAPLCRSATFFNKDIGDTFSVQDTQGGINYIFTLTTTLITDEPFSGIPLNTTTISTTTIATTTPITTSSVQNATASIG
ncbi:unnamed protein product [Rotaria magnacalcarata]|uniref:Uncharacterized protein n=1 Tax=Rotaria magnacalcarata TaxID=392030 RepID=A0A815TU73_9BILA|nr:unnamed protein product [Rotaria magnacalcarata]CAF1594222.1 unnamed protein product [Rotaria magnacalcarata]CAF3781512.1 unnamed protein product [Rotaria magnacalcarata]CAF3804651.1 unnamed protein product [Rotaria magnacalcarata]